MRIKTILNLLLAAILLFTCGCAPTNSDSEQEASALKEMRDSRYVYLTLWSWQVPTAQDAQAYAEKAKECGFTAVDLGVLWSSFEPLRGHFQWEYLDSVVSAFTAAGLKISLQPLLWTEGLSWAGDLALQEQSNGTVYAMEDRGSYLSFTDEKTLSIVENTLQNFALHARSTYADHLTRWGVRLSCFGEFDYSVNEALDYSVSAKDRFYDYLQETYGSWRNLSEARGLLVSSRKDLDSMSLDSVIDACPGDWRRFRQERLFDLLDRMIDVYRSADPSIPVVFSLGTYGNGMNTAYSGVVDLWSAVEEHDVDIVALSFCDGADGDMMLSLITSLTTKRISVEVDGAWALDEGRDVGSFVDLCGKHGVFSLATANFTVEQLNSYQEILSSYPERFSSSGALGDRDPTRAILILSNALAEMRPPKSFDALYGDLWASLSEQGARRVRFVTEDQIASGEISLEGVSTLYCGEIKGSVSVSKAFAEALAKTKTTLRGDLSFRFLDGSSPEGDLKTALAERIQAE
ncbi:MAG: beta-galactosidase [Clostridia bacterium]|nr:beta-galactosidase [Clostridia bacterium]